MECELSAERARLESRITLNRSRMDAAYTDKLDGKITDEFWQRKRNDWQMEEQQAKMALDRLANAETSDRALDAEKCSNSRIVLIFFILARIRPRRPNCSE